MHTDYMSKSVVNLSKTSKFLFVQRPHGAQVEDRGAATP
jgi:hypothetical protein